MYSLLGLLPIVIMGFRSLTFLSIAFIFIMIPFVIRKFGKTIVMAIASVFLLFALSQIGIVQDKIDEMLERQEGGQTFENKDYIRYLEYDYFSSVMFDKPGERYIGGGVPSDPSSRYYTNIENAVDVLHFFWMDLGLVGLTFIIGVPAVVLLVFIVVKCLLNAKSPELQYIRFSLLTILLGSLGTSMEIFRPGNLLIISLYLCSVHTYNFEQKAMSCKEPC